MNTFTELGADTSKRMAYLMEDAQNIPLPIKTLLVILANHIDFHSDWWDEDVIGLPTQKKLAKELKCSVPVMKRLIGEARERGYIIGGPVDGASGDLWTPEDGYCWTYMFDWDAIRNVGNLEGIRP